MSNRAKFLLNRMRTQHFQFKLFDTDVTLKYNQGQKARMPVVNKRASYGLIGRVLRSVYKMPEQCISDRIFSPGLPGMAVCMLRI